MSQQSSHTRAQPAEAKKENAERATGSNRMTLRDELNECQEQQISFANIYTARRATNAGVYTHVNNSLGQNMKRPHDSHFTR